MPSGATNFYTETFEKLEGNIFVLSDSVAIFEALISGESFGIFLSDTGGLGINGYNAPGSASFW